MYEIKEYDDSLDLNYFYDKCKKKGYSNNCSKSKLVKNLITEKEFKLWILYFNQKPIGTTALHGFEDVMGENSYRICVRTCVISEDTHLSKVRTLEGILQHQNITSQIYIPLCLDHIKNKGLAYITTCDKDTASMKAVHHVYAPALSKKGILKKIKDIFYKGTQQTVWLLDRDQFVKQVAQDPQCKYKLV